MVWENFRPGVMDRLGLGYEALSRLNPRLIYCAVSGFGHTGPERTTAAFDGKLQAMSGIMSITGEPAGGPMRAGFAICDTIGGMTAALAVASALYQRTHTGKGQFVDVAMLDAALAFIPGPVSEWTVAGIEQKQIGNGSVSRKPTANRFRAKDSFLVLAVLTEPQWVRLMTAIGRADALDDPRFKDWASRTANFPALREVIEGALASDDAKTWEARLTKADVPCSSIWRIDEIVEHPQLEHRDVLQTVELEVRSHAAGRIGVPPRARESRHRPAAADARRAHRRDPARGGLQPGRDRVPPRPRRRLSARLARAPAGSRRAYFLKRLSNARRMSAALFPSGDAFFSTLTRSVNEAQSLRAALSSIRSGIGCVHWKRWLVSKWAHWRHAWMSARQLGHCSSDARGDRQERRRRLRTATPCAGREHRAAWRRVRPRRFRAAAAPGILIPVPGSPAAGTSGPPWSAPFNPSAGDAGIGNRVVRQPHPADDALRRIVDVALVIRLDVDVQAHGILADRLHRVDVGGAVDVAGLAVQRPADRLEAEGLPRQLPVAREPEQAALDARPAQLPSWPWIGARLPRGQHSTSSSTAGLLKTRWRV